mgnify:CR=1 FL=1
MMTRELTSVRDRSSCFYLFIYLLFFQTPIRDKQQQSSTIRTLPSDERIHRSCKNQSTSMI